MRLKTNTWNIDQMNRHLIIILASVVALSCSTKDKVYQNPVWDMAAPDPTVIRSSNGKYYMYTTNGNDPERKMCNIQVLESKDLVHWKHLGDALPEKPTWASNTQNFWAPHVIEANGKYYLYFSGEPDNEYKTGKDLGLCLAVAISDKPQGPFKESGKPMISGDGFINIDPMVFKDPLSNKYYMYWGSGFEPLKVRELDESLTSFKEDSPTVELVKPFQSSYQFLVEGSWVLYNDGFYYLFYSGDNCCGERAHYAVMVARSDSPLGPFEVLKKEKEGDCPILEYDDKWLAPGHNSVVEDGEGKYWIVYHAIDRNDRWNDPKTQTGDKRVVLIDELTFNDGWPVVGDGTPSESIMTAPSRK